MMSDVLTTTIWMGKPATSDLKGILAGMAAKRKYRMVVKTRKYLLGSCDKVCQ
jgi:hypothetical protein